MSDINRFDLTRAGFLERQSSPRPNSSTIHLSARKTTTCDLETKYIKTTRFFLFDVSASSWPESHMLSFTPPCQTQCGRQQLICFCSVVFHNNALRASPSKKRAKLVVCSFLPNVACPIHRCELQMLLSCLELRSSVKRFILT